MKEKSYISLDDLDLTEKQRSALAAQIILANRLGKDAVFKFNSKTYRLKRISASSLKDKKIKNMVIKQVRTTNK